MPTCRTRRSRLPGGAIAAVLMVAVLMPAVLMAAVLMAATGALPGVAVAQVACPIGAVDDSAVPPIDVDHIFCGEINDRGRAVGFHARPGGASPGTVGGMTDITRDAPFPGAYEVRDFTITVDGESADKPISTMFPDACSYEDVLAAIRHAYETGRIDGNSFRGPSGPRCRDADGEAFSIQGYTRGNGPTLSIITAFPQ